MQIDKKISGIGFFQHLAKWQKPLKLLLVLLFIVLIFSKIRDQNFRDFVANLWLISDGQKAGYLLIAMLLMPVNWLIEAIKWRVIAKEYAPISTRRALSGVLAGNFFSIMTPMRIGDYFGRMIPVGPDQNLKTSIATFISSFAQNIVILGFGLTSLIWYLIIHDVISEPISWVLGSISAVIIIAFTYLYFFQKWLVGIFKKSRIKWLVKLSKGADFLLTIKKSSLTNVLVLSTLRYVIYICQYILLMRLFGIELSFSLLFLSIALIFLLKTGIPLPALFGVLANGEFALQIIGGFGENELSILSATLLLWIINLIIPALGGMYVVLKTNISIKPKYEELS